MSATFIEVERARKHVFDALEPVGRERLFLSEAVGRRVGERLVAPEPAPRFDNSSRDGWAVRWEDVEDAPVELEIAGKIDAGDEATVDVGPGLAARITTGGPVPDGADTVVMQEYTEADGETVVVREAPDPGKGAWIRPAGDYVDRGDVLVRPGDRIESPEVGLLASFRRSRLTVHRRPSVGIVSTGDELVDIDTAPGPAEIVDSNSHQIASLVREAGGNPVTFPRASDVRTDVEERFERAVRETDIVVSSGGVSVGDDDLVGDVLDDLADGMDFWKVKSKPGAPLAFGTADRGGDSTPLLGLPGNPNSGFVCFHQFVAPALQVLQGLDREAAAPTVWSARLAAPVSSTPRRRHYLAGRLEQRDGELVFVPFDDQKSANVALFTGADAFGRVPEGIAQMEADEAIDVERIDAAAPSDAPQQEREHPCSR